MMPVLRVVLDGEGAFPELEGKKIHRVREEFKLTVLGAGMASGAPSVAFVIPLEDGSVVFAETSLRVLLTAADLIRSKWGDPR